jgi:hypothetical protein
MKTSPLVHCIFLLVLFTTNTSCKKDDPAPALSIVSIKSGTLDLNSGTSATKVSVSLPIVIVFSTKIDASTATSTNVTLGKGTSNASIGISVDANTITITPTISLGFGSDYSLTISTALKSDKGMALSNQASVSFTTDEPSKVYFYQVVATPTDSESVTLKNNSGTDQDISGWTIGDTNNPIAYKIPNGTVVKQGETKLFPHTTIGFAINDSGEILHLKNTSGTEIDTWTN